MLDLYNVKQWLRVEHDDDDYLIERLISTATQYLKNATGREFKPNNELANQYRMVLIAEWYENRDFVKNKVGDRTRFILESMMLQLQYEEDIEDAG